MMISVVWGSFNAAEMKSSSKKIMYRLILPLMFLLERSLSDVLFKVSIRNRVNPYCTKRTLPLKKRAFSNSNTTAKNLSLNLTD
jgi:hypothetical protein